MEFPTFQDGMFPKCAHLLLCRAQIFGFRSHFAVDSVNCLCYDGCVGVDFFPPPFCCTDRRERLWPFPTLGRASISNQRNDPRQKSGVISFPWVRSLGNLAFCGIDRSLMVGWNPFRSIHVLQLTCAIGIYVKRKMVQVRPAGVVTISGITFFRTPRIPFFFFVYKTGFHTNNFRNYGIKQRNTHFISTKC